jgi:hypothetical protein
VLTHQSSYCAQFDRMEAMIIRQRRRVEPEFAGAPLSRSLKASRTTLSPLRSGNLSQVGEMIQVRLDEQLTQAGLKPVSHRDPGAVDHPKSLPEPRRPALRASREGYNTIATISFATSAR